MRERLKRYRDYLTIVRDQPAPDHANAWDRKTAKLYFDLYPELKMIDFCRREHNTNTSRYIPLQGSMIYVKATTGSWGKSTIVRVSKELKRKD